MFILSECKEKVNDNSFFAGLNLTTADQYNWESCQGIIGRLGVSPSQTAEPRLTLSVQRKAIEQFAKSKGLPIIDWADKGKSGHRIEKDFREKIKLARENHLTVVAVEWRRFCREPHKLAEAGAGVDFVTLLPLLTDEGQLNGLCKKLSNKWRGETDGRPADFSTQSACLLYSPS